MEITGYRNRHGTRTEQLVLQFPEGRYLHCPEGSHMAFYDDQQPYFKGLVIFMKDVDR